METEVYDKKPEFNYRLYYVTNRYSNNAEDWHINFFAPNDNEAIEISRNYINGLRKKIEKGEVDFARVNAENLLKLTIEKKWVKTETESIWNAWPGPEFNVPKEI